MAVRCKGFEVDGVIYDEMPDKLAQKIIDTCCSIHLLIVKDKQEEEPEDPAA